jgi:hypothetical protein
MRKGLFADLSFDEIIVVSDVENPLVAVVWADIIDLLWTILLAANKTF